MPSRGLIRILKRIRQAILMAFVWVWRRMMYRTTFIAITGSVGKSTTRDVITDILSSKFEVISNRRGGNHFSGLFKTVLRVRPWHRFAVLEVGIVMPGQMIRMARALRPDIAVWVSVAHTHTMNYEGLEDIAREKSELVNELSRTGVAVLNDDNPWIAAYQPPPEVRAIYYGSTDRSSYRASGLTSRWPERLSFDLSTSDGLQTRIATQMLGEHWISSILPGFAVATACGITLDEAAAVLARIKPVSRRLSPELLPNGATIIRDDYNGSFDTIGPALKVLEEADAKRKMLVMTDVSDSPKKPRTRLRDYGRAAARAGHAAIFIGENCEHGARAAIEAGLPADQVWAFYNTLDAAQHLKSELRDGDLVLIRGRQVDHIERLFLSLVGDVTCWRNRCNKQTQCTRCRLLDAKRPAAGSSGALTQLKRLTYQR